MTYPANGSERKRKKMRIYKQTKGKKQLITSNYNYTNDERLRMDLDAFCMRTGKFGVTTIDSHEENVVKLTFSSVVIFDNPIRFICEL